MRKLCGCLKSWTKAVRVSVSHVDFKPLQDWKKSAVGWFRHAKSIYGSLQTVKSLSVSLLCFIFPHLWKYKSCHFPTSGNAVRINTLIRTIMTGRGCWRSSSSTPFFKAAVLQDQTAQDLVPWRLQDARILKKEEEIKKNPNRRKWWILFVQFPLYPKAQLMQMFVYVLSLPPYSYELATSSEWGEKNQISIRLISINLQ